MTAVIDVGAVIGYLAVGILLIRLGTAVSPVFKSEMLLDDEPVFAGIVVIAWPVIVGFVGLMLVVSGLGRLAGGKSQ